LPELSLYLAGVGGFRKRACEASGTTNERSPIHSVVVGLCATCRSKIRVHPIGIGGEFGVISLCPIHGSGYVPLVALQAGDDPNAPISKKAPLLFEPRRPSIAYDPFSYAPPDPNPENRKV